MEENQLELSKRERQKLNREKGKIESLSEKKETGIFNKLIVVVLVIGLAFLAWKFLTADKSVSDSSNSQVTADTSEGSKIKESDYVYGKADSQVLLVEYGDYQCPGCAAYYPLIKQIKEEYKDRVAFIHRDFPLRQAHKHAQIAAQAAQAAGMQGKFWEMHDKLYENQDSWKDVRDPRSDFEKFAAEIGLDIEKFKTDMNSDTARELVNNSYNSAIAMGLNQTPSFILNGQVISAPQGVAPFKALLDAELAKFTNSESTPSAEVKE